jgi:hypothetical protein
MSDVVKAKTPAEWIQLIANIAIYVVTFAGTIVGILGITGAIEVLSGLPAIIETIAAAGVLAASGIYDIITAQLKKS